MKSKEQIIKIKKLISVLHLSMILLLFLDAIVFFFALFKYKSNFDTFLIYGLSCVMFVIVVIIVLFFAERRIKRNLKEFVEKFAGKISEYDKKTSGELLEK